MILPVHPRVCGERASYPGCSPRNTGSSPRVRGTPWDWREMLDRDRFIPACAGNAICVTCHPVLRSVHPRVCGER